MRPRAAFILGSVLVLLLSPQILDRAAARLVRSDTAAPANPAVESGGHHLPPRPPPPVPYSLVGVLARWALWPWQWFGSPPGLIARPGPAARPGPRLNWVPPPPP